MSVNKKEYVDILKRNGSMNNPELFNLLDEGQIMKSFSMKSGDTLVPDELKLRTISDLDIFDFLENKEKINLAYKITRNEDICIQKEYEIFIPMDILNKKILNMFNENCKLVGIEYSISMKNNSEKRKYTYFDNIILRAIYNFYRENMFIFTTNDVYYQIFQCYGANTSIKKGVKEQINDSLNYLLSIEIKVNAYDIFKQVGLLCPIKQQKKDSKDNITYLLTSEPILYSYAINVNHFMIDKHDKGYKFNQGKRILKNLTLYIKLLDFIYSIKRSTRKSMNINITTIFYECDMTFNNKTNKVKVIDKIKKYLDSFKDNGLILTYDFDNVYDKKKKRKTKNIKIYDISYKPKIKNTTLEAVKKSKEALLQSIENSPEIYYEELQKKELESVSNSNSSDKNAFHDVDKQKEEEIIREYFSDFDFDIDF